MAVEIISTVLVAATAAAPAGPYDLTDLATVHDELSIPTNATDNDAFLQRAITQASRAIKNHCNRVFQVEAIQDQCYIQQDAYPWQNPAGVYPLQLTRWPLVNATPVTFIGTTNGTTLVQGIASTAGIVEGELIFAADGCIPPGTTVVTVTSNSIVLSAAASSSESVSITTGIQVIQTLAAGYTQTLAYGSDYTVDAKRGWLIRLNTWTGESTRWEAEPVTVQYQAGYNPIEDDLIEATLRMVTARFRARGRDPMLVQRNQPDAIGMERYWVGTAPGQVGTLPPEVVELVDHYRVPVTA